MGCGEWEGFVQEDSRGAARDGVAVGSEAGGHGGCESEEYRHQFFHLTAAVRGVQLLNVPIPLVIPMFDEDYWHDARAFDLSRGLHLSLSPERKLFCFSFLDLRFLVKGSSQ